MAPGTLAELPLEQLLQRQIRALVLDVDRTLLPYSGNRMPASVESWLRQAQQRMPLHLFSNNPSRSRIGGVAEDEAGALVGEGDDLGDGRREDIEDGDDGREAEEQERERELEREAAEDGAAADRPAVGREGVADREDGGDAEDAGELLHGRSELDAGYLRGVSCAE
ncbi:MAG: hypothetical protein RLZZ124_803 [Cyanobacteriota bacterium]